MRTKAEHRNPNLKRGPQGGPRIRSPPRRIVFNDGSVTLWAWPSRGGLIVHEHATALDFGFLNLSPVEFALYRDPDPAAEDAFAQRLLLLGAKWFDSQARRAFVAGVEEREDVELDAIRLGEQPAPNAMERRWISVAYPDGEGPAGGFWVAEFDTPMLGWDGREKCVPLGVAEQVPMARNMQEKAQIIERIGGKFYASMDAYDGMACLDTWRAKSTGFFGPLEGTGNEQQ